MPSVAGLVMGGRRRGTARMRLKPGLRGVPHDVGPHEERIHRRHRDGSPEEDLLLVVPVHVIHLTREEVQERFRRREWADFEGPIARLGQRLRRFLCFLAGGAAGWTTYHTECLKSRPVWIFGASANFAAA